MIFNIYEPLNTIAGSVIRGKRKETGERPPVEPTALNEVS